MSFHKFNNVKITGISSIVPKNTIKLEDEIQYYNNDINQVKRLQKIIGCHERRISPNDATSCDYAIRASEILINNMDIDTNSIDALIYTSQNPDYTIPSTAFYIHKKLKLSKQCIVFDEIKACTGFVHALLMASIFIESKQFKKVLLAFGCISQGTKNYDNRNVAPILGDGGTAILVESVENTISIFNEISLSEKQETLMIPFNGSKSFLQDILYEDYANEIKDMLDIKKHNKISVTDLYMEGMEVFKFTAKETVKNVKDLLEYADYKIDDIEAFCFHQANSQIVKNLASTIGIDKNKASTEVFEKYGNTSFNSIPALFNTTYFNKIKNNKVKKFLVSGFGAGLSCSSAIIDLNNIYLSGMIEEDVKPEMTKREYYNYWKNKHLELN